MLKSFVPNITHVLVVHFSLASRHNGSSFSVGNATACVTLRVPCIHLKQPTPGPALHPQAQQPPTP